MTHKRHAGKHNRAGKSVKGTMRESKSVMVPFTDLDSVKVAFTDRRSRAAHWSGLRYLL